MKDGQTYVDVEPELVLVTDVGDGVDGIERSEDGGAGSGRDEERDLALGDGFEDEALELGRNHLAPATSNRA